MNIISKMTAVDVIKSFGIVIIVHFLFEIFARIGIMVQKKRDPQYREGKGLIKSIKKQGLRKVFIKSSLVYFGFIIVISLINISPTLFLAAICLSSTYFITFLFQIINIIANGWNR